MVILGKTRSRFGLALFLLSAVFYYSGCGGSNKFEVGVVRPLMVIDGLPANGADNIDLTAPVTAVFSDPLDPATVGSDSFRVLGPEWTSCPGTVTASGAMVVFTPDAPYAYSATYTVVISKGIQRADDGAVLALEVERQFKTLDPPALIVLSTDPGDGATGIGEFLDPVSLLVTNYGSAASAAISIHFSEGLNAQTVTGESFKVEDAISGSEIAGSLAFSSSVSDDPLSAGDTLTFTPDSPWGLSRTIRVTLNDEITSSRATDESGQLLPAPYVFEFSTTDPPPLYLVSASPFDGSQNAGRLYDSSDGIETEFGGGATESIELIFSESVEPGSVNPATAFLEIVSGNTVTVVTGSFIFDAAAADPALDWFETNRVTFRPDAPLNLSEDYRMTLVSGLGGICSYRATDVAGCLPAPDIVLSFDVIDPLPLRVLGSSPGDGDLNVGKVLDSGVSESVTVYFSERLDIASVVNGTTFMVQECLDGAACASLGAALAGTIDFQSSNIADAWTTNDILTWTPAANLKYSTYYLVSLASGPAGILSWRSTLEGGELKSPPGDLNISFKTAAPPALNLWLSSPADGADSISRAADIELLFSEDLDPATFDSSTIVITNDSPASPYYGLRIAIALIVFPAGDSALITLSPQAGVSSKETGLLDYTTLYKVTLTGGSSGIASLRATADSGWLEPALIEIGFKTEDPPVLALVALDPSGSSAGIMIGSNIELIFNQAVDPACLTAANLYLSAVTEPTVKLAVNYSQPVATKLVMTPVSPLRYDTEYLIHLEGGSPSGLRSTSATAEGGYLPATLEFQFHTERYPDLSVESVSPADGAVSISTNTQIKVVFSNSLYASTLTAEPAIGASDGYEPNFFIYKGLPGDYSDPATAVAWTDAVTGTVSTTESRTAVFTPNVPFDFDSAYTIVASSDIIDLDNQRLPATFTASFRTRVSNLIDLVSPYNGQTGVDISTKIMVDFTTYISKATVNARSMYLTYTDDLGVTRVVPGVFTYEDRAGAIADAGDDLDGLGDGDPNTIDRAWFTPDPTLSPCLDHDLKLRYDTLYTIHFKSLIWASDGSDHVTAIAESFTTRSEPVLTSVVARNANVSRTLSATETVSEVPVNSAIVLTFAENMDSATIDSSTFQVNAGAIAGTVTEVSPSVYQFAPAANLSYAMAYTVTIAGGDGGISDADGNSLSRDYTYHFITSPSASHMAIPQEAGTGDQADAYNIFFTRPLDVRTLTDAEIIFEDLTSGVIAAGVIGYDEKTQTLTFLPVPMLDTGHNYRLTVSTGVADNLGNPLSADIVLTLNAGGAALSCKADFSMYGSTTNIQGHALIRFLSDDPFSFTGLKPPNVVLTDSVGSEVPYSLASITPTGMEDFIVALKPDNYLREASGDYTLDIMNMADLSRNRCSDLTGVTISIEGISPTATLTEPSVSPASAIEAIVVTFNEPIDEATAVNGTTFRLTTDADCTGATYLEGELSVTGGVMTFTPSAPLDAGTTYRVCLTAAITDTAGNANATVGELDSFSIETTAPAVNGGATVLPGAPGDALVIAFTEPIDLATLYSTPVPGTLQITYPDACAVDQAVFCCLTPNDDAWHSDTFTCEVPELFPGDTSFTVSLDETIVADLAGNLLNPAFSDSFSTSTGDPEVSCTDPADGANPAGVGDIVIYFNEAVADATVTAANIEVYSIGTGLTVGGSFATAGSVVTFTPATALETGQEYEVIVSPAVTDVGGASLKTLYRFFFVQ